MEIRIYGGVFVYRGQCVKCKRVGFFNGAGECQHCRYPNPCPESATPRRVSTVDPTGNRGKHKLSMRAKKRILLNQACQCYYCAIDLRREGVKVHYDHFIPWVSVHDTKEPNMVAACSRCNLVKSASVFNSRHDAAECILARRLQKGDVFDWDTTYFGRE